MTTFSTFEYASVEALVINTDWCEVADNNGIVETPIGNLRLHRNFINRSGDFCVCIADENGDAVDVESVRFGRNFATQSVERPSDWTVTISELEVETRLQLLETTPLVVHFRQGFYIRFSPE
jgi:hypothetical protein